MPRLDSKCISCYDQLGAIGQVRQGNWYDTSGPDRRPGEIPAKLDDGSVWYFEAQEWRSYATPGRGVWREGPKVPDYLCPNCAGPLSLSRDTDAYRCQACGRLYTELYLAGTISSQVNQIPTGDTCHVLSQGSPLCGFSHSRPVDWPKGHVWVPMDTVRNRQEGQSTGVTCESCMDKAMAILSLKP